MKSAGFWLVVSILSLAAADGMSLARAQSTVPDPSSQAAISNPPRANPLPIATSTGRTAAEGGLPMIVSAWLSGGVLVFGSIVLVAEMILLRMNKAQPNEVLRVFAVTVIIIGSLFSITAGFGPEQIAPTIGLFGTIAGYLLGRAHGHPRQEKSDE